MIESPGRRRTLRALVAATLTVAALVLSGCAYDTNGAVPLGADGLSVGYRLAEAEVPILYAAGDSGGVAVQRISVEPSGDGELSIDISHDEVAGVGDMTQAASWNAVSVATLLTGAPLDQSYRFAFDGRVDGPSAGAITTVALLSLFHGHQLAPDVVMTGTINPMGTIGTVGGIPEKVRGVIEHGGITTVLIPTGQRNVIDAAGQEIDVVALGAAGGVDVVEVADIATAYPLVTGQTLPGPAASGAPAVSAAGYDKFRSATDGMLATYERARGDFASLDASLQAAAGTIPEDAAAYAERSRSLQAQGLQGGAFYEASQAALLMDATASAFRTVQDLLITGGDAISARLDYAASAEGEFLAFLDQLGTFEPETLGDAEALITAYGNAFDSYTLLQFATAALEEVAAGIAAATYTDLDSLLFDALMPLVYYDVARGNLEFAKAVFEVGRDNGGAALEPDADLEAIASFFRRAADADWAAFETGVIQPAAEQRGASNDVFRNALAAVDLDVALSYTAQQSVASIERYLAEGSNAPFATMGYGYANYARNALLIEKYYNNGVLDENLELVGVASEAVLTNALENGRDRSAAGIAALEAQETDPVLTAGAYEQAGVAREGDLSEKFSAIAQYSAAYVLTRILAYAGGFEREGYAAEAADSR